MRRPPPKSRLDQVIDLTREAHGMAIATLVQTSADSAIVVAMLAFMREAGILKPEMISELFIRAIALLDAAAKRSPDETQRNASEAARGAVREMAASPQSAARWLASTARMSRKMRSAALRSSATSAAVAASMRLR